MLLPLIMYTTPTLDEFLLDMADSTLRNYLTLFVNCVCDRSLNFINLDVYPLCTHLTAKCCVI